MGDETLWLSTERQLALLALEPGHGDSLRLATKVQLPLQVCCSNRGIGGESVEGVVCHGLACSRYELACILCKSAVVFIIGYSATFYSFAPNTQPNELMSGIYCGRMVL